MVQNCNTSSLSPYPTTLNEAKVRHVYRRIGFGASNEKISQGSGKTATELIDNLLLDAVNNVGLPSYDWSSWDVTNYPSDSSARNTLRLEQFYRLRNDYTQFLLEGDALGRISFFWTNHFVTAYTNHVGNSYQYEYLDCILRNSVGNFKTFVKEMGLTNAMLFYLDGAFSPKDNPNENYARELYELFTLGEGNGYTEQDIVETSRALTGYFITLVTHTQWSPVNFRAEHFDNTNKTIFGRTGNWDYFDVIDILFEEKGSLIARHICRKLYEFYVHPDSSSENANSVINSLATTFTSSNFEILPVLSELFKSTHFYDDNTIGVIIKSPYDLFLSMLNEIGGLAIDDGLLGLIDEATRTSGQRIFNPPDVAGWQRNRFWISSDFMISRWNYSFTLIWKAQDGDKEYFRNWALNLVGDVGLTSNDPDVVARLIIDKILPKGLHSEEEYTKAFIVFRSDVSNAYYAGGETPSWTLAIWQSSSRQVDLLLQYLVKEPDFQLK